MIDPTHKAPQTHPLILAIESLLQGRKSIHGPREVFRAMTDGEKGQFLYTVSTTGHFLNKYPEISAEDKFVICSELGAALARAEDNQAFSSSNSPADHPAIPRPGSFLQNTRKEK